MLFYIDTLVNNIFGQEGVFRKFCQRSVIYKLRETKDFDACCFPGIMANRKTAITCLRSLWAAFEEFLEPGGLVSKFCNVAGRQRCIA